MAQPWLSEFAQALLHSSGHPYNGSLYGSAPPPPPTPYNTHNHMHSHASTPSPAVASAMATILAAAHQPASVANTMLHQPPAFQRPSERIELVHHVKVDSPSLPPAATSSNQDMPGQQFHSVQYADVRHFNQTTGNNRNAPRAEAPYNPYREHALDQAEVVEYPGQLLLNGADKTRCAKCFGHKHWAVNCRSTKDGGWITWEELYNVLHHNGMVCSKCKGFLHTVDTCQNGPVRNAQILDLASFMQRPEVPAEYRYQVREPSGAAGRVKKEGAFQR